MDDWNTTFLLGWPIFRAMFVSGRVLIPHRSMASVTTGVKPLRSDGLEYRLSQEMVDVGLGMVDGGEPLDSRHHHLD